VRRWAYILLGRLPDIEFDLTTDLLNRENDAENLSWAVSALSSRHGYSEAKGIALSRNIPLTPTQIALSSSLYDTSCVRKDLDFPKIIESDDGLTRRWIPLLNSYTEKEIRQPLDDIGLNNFINVLTTDYTAEVSEYSIWSLFHSGHSISNLNRPIHYYLERESNVRKWMYRLMSRSKSKRGIFEILSGRISEEKDNHAREGLALGLMDFYEDRLRRDVIQWFFREEFFPAKIAIFKLFLRELYRIEDFAEIVFEELERGDPILHFLSESIVLKGIGSEDVKNKLTKNKLQSRIYLDNTKQEGVNLKLSVKNSENVNLNLGQMGSFSVNESNEHQTTQIIKALEEARDLVSRAQSTMGSKIENSDATLDNALSLAKDRNSNSKGRFRNALKKVTNLLGFVGKCKDTPSDIAESTENLKNFLEAIIS
jgi:flagellin-like hook-associated protein FlgL